MSSSELCNNTTTMSTKTAGEQQQQNDNKTNKRSLDECYNDLDKALLVQDDNARNLIFEELNTVHSMSKDSALVQLNRWQKDRLDREIARRKELEAQTKELEAQRKELEAQRKELEALTDGTYYTRFTSLWTKKAEAYNDDHYTAMIREKIPSIRSYQITLAKAADPKNIVKDDGKSARTSHQKKKIKEAIWPCDIFGYPKQQAQPKDDNDSSSLEDHTTSTPSTASQSGVNVNTQIMNKIQSHATRTDFQAPYSSTINASQEAEEDNDVVVDDESKQALNKVTIVGDIAHLVPASPLHASLFHFVAGWAFGRDSQGIAAEVVQKLIHGCRSEEESRRLDNTGLKHLVSNKIRLRGQKENYDEAPNVLIVPIYSLDKTKNWSGENYDAIVLIGTKNEQNLKSIAAAIGMQESHDLATRDEIEMARELLTATLKGMAQALQKFRNNNDQPWSRFLTPKHTEVLRKLWDKIPKNSTTFVPTKMEEDKEPKVCKIHFVQQESSQGHPAPDPLLLVVKAAINWSAFYDQKLLAGGEVYDDDDDSMSILAEEQYLEWCTAQTRLEPLPFDSITIPAIESSQELQ